MSVVTQEHHLILVVDDEPVMLRSITRSLAKFGFYSEIADSAEVALGIVEHSEDVEVVVADDVLPGIQGIEFLQAIKDQFPSIARILMSGFPSACHDTVRRIDGHHCGPISRLEAAINKGEILRFLAKPFTPEQLREAVQAGIRWHQQQASLSIRDSDEYQQLREELIKNKIGLKALGHQIECSKRRS